ncbi:MAG: EFR1 family ferrodoxin [Deltaproteobacteria bacterium]|nr:EFR1 family ferrodoxin [Deltaproteobacteria bacterium]
MKTDIYFYTGTGNSYWVARTLANELGDAETHPMFWNEEEKVASRGDAAGLIFPVHIWGLPRRVIAFANALAKDPTKYWFAVAVNAGQVAATLMQLKKLMNANGLSLKAGFEIPMASNYIPWGGPGPEDEIRRKINDAREKIKTISAVVVRRETRPVEKGPLWQNVLLSGLLYKLSFRHIPAMDKKFWVDERCNGCGICEIICPCRNIEMNHEKPSWLHGCEQCLACIQWCPREAIQYGKKTPGYERYHHPEIKLSDLTSLAKEKQRGRSE